jgi:hypothetical protein
MQADDNIPKTFGNPPRLHIEVASPCRIMEGDCHGHFLRRSRASVIRIT